MACNNIKLKIRKENKTVEVNSELYPELQKHYKDELGSSKLGEEYYRVIFSETAIKGRPGYFSNYMFKRLFPGANPKDQVNRFSWKNQAHRLEGLNKGFLRESTQEPTLKFALEFINSYITEKNQIENMTGPGKEAMDQVENVRSVLNDVMNTLEIAIVNIHRNILDPEQKENEQAELEKLNRTIEKFMYTSPIHGVYEYVNKAKEDTLFIKDQLKKKVLDRRDNNPVEISDMLSIEDLDKFKNYVDRYRDVDDIRKLVQNEDNPLGISTEDRNNLMSIINDVLLNRDYVHDKYKQEGLNLLANQLAPYESTIRNKHTEQLEKIWEKLPENKDVKKNKQNQTAKNLWIQHQLKDREKQMHNESVKQIKDWLLFSDFDIDGIRDVWLKTAKDLPDHVLQLLYIRLRDAEESIRLDFNDKWDQGHDIYQKYRDYMFTNYKVMSGNSGKFYAPILEKDKKGSITGEYVSEYLSTWDKKYKEMRASLMGLVKAEKQRIVNEFHKKNSIRRSDDKGNVYFAPNDSYKNPQWTELEKLRKENPENPVIQMYDWILSTREVSEGLKPKSARLGYRIPSVRKGTYERYRTANPKKWASHTKTMLWEMIHRHNMDTDIGEVSGMQDKYQVTEDFEIVGTQRVDLERKPNKHIPLNFSNKDLEVKDISLDIFSSELLNYYSSKNFYEKMKIIPEANLATFLIEKRKVRRSESGIGKIMKLFNRNKKEAAFLKPDEMNSLKALDSFYNQFLFGEELKEAYTFLYGKGITLDLVEGKTKVADTLKEISVNKLSAIFMRWWSLVALGVNWVSAASNLLQGTSQNISDAAGGEYFGPTSWAIGGAKFYADLPRMLMDAGVQRPKSKTALLMRLFDAGNTFSGLTNKQYNMATRLQNLGQGLTYMLTNVAEFKNHAHPMYSYLNNIKVVDENGQFITTWKQFNKEGKEARRKGAMTVDEAFKVKDGNLVLDERVAGTEWNLNIKPDDKKFIFHHSLLLQDINEKQHGAYARNNKKPYQNTLAGHNIAFLKKFWTVLADRRYLGLGRKGQKVYKHITGKEEQGLYITTFNYIAGLIPDLWRTIKERKLEIMTERWGELTKHQKANIRNTMAQLALYSITVSLGNLYRSRGDEEPEGENVDDYLLAFFMLRLSTELSAYVNPGETWKLLKSPAATLTLIERIGDLVSQLGSDVYAGEWELYKQGHMKGRPKIIKDIKNVVPFWKHVDRHLTIDDALRFYSPTKRTESTISTSIQQNRGRRPSRRTRKTR